MDRERGPRASAADHELWATLAELARLRDSGVLDHEGYEFHRKRIVARASAPPDPQPAPPPPPPPPEPSRRWVANAAAAATAVVISAATAAGALALTQPRSTAPATAANQGSPPATDPAGTAPDTVAPQSTTLPQSAPIAGVHGAPILWTQRSDGSVVVSPIAGGVDVHLVKPDVQHWVPVPVAGPSFGMRVDATMTVTRDHSGNRVGLSCVADDRSHAATFSIDATGTWRVSLEDISRSTLVGSGQSPAIHAPGTPNALSIVCVTSGSSLMLMFAVNGQVVANDTGPSITSQAWMPSIFLCSCFGDEELRVQQLQVGSVTSGTSVARIVDRGAAILAPRRSRAVPN